MTPRETRLLLTLGLSLSVGLTLVAASTLFDHWVALDQRKVNAQRLAMKRIQTVPTSGLDPTPKELFWAKNDPMSAGQLALETTKRLEQVRLPALEVRILEDTDQRGWIQVSASGLASAWLEFLALSYADRPHVFFRNLRIHLKEGAMYDFSFEVGYERLP